MKSNSRAKNAPGPAILGFTNKVNGADQVADQMEIIEHFRLQGRSIIRNVLLRNGEVVESSIPMAVGQRVESNDLAAAFDEAWLRSHIRPNLISDSKHRNIRIVDLFCGAGGMSVGIDEACRAIGVNALHVLAADLEQNALATYSENFSPEIAESRPVQDWIDSPLGSKLSKSELRLKKDVGKVDLLVGGPPCQGHSDLNNHTRRQDPKNALYDRMARFAEIVEPTHIIIENVPGVRHDKDGIFFRTLDTLRDLGYSVDASTIYADRIGTPQRRKRAVIVASKAAPISDDFLNSLERKFSRPTRSVRWAISDLLGVNRSNELDALTVVSKVSQQRIDWLFDNDTYDLPNEMRPDCHRLKVHTYKSVYGRLFWEEPSWTITTGFQVMGQGRFLHPLQRRVITSHEAARLQFFPDFFRFKAHNRKWYAKMIGNAVPTKLAYVLALELLR